MRFLSVAAAVLGTALTALLAASSYAQEQTATIAGSIQAVDGPIIVVKQSNGKEAKVTLSDKLVVSGVVKKSASDIKQDDYVGVGAVPQADGRLRAIRISIFPADRKGTNEGFGPWSGAPDGTMTNATVDTLVTDVNGPVLTLKYKGGEKTVVVTPQTQITTSVAGDPSEIKPGANVRMVGATKNPDGTFAAARISVGRDGVVPR
jgi:hypothetical protein